VSRPHILLVCTPHTFTAYQSPIYIHHAVGCTNVGTIEENGMQFCGTLSCPELKLWLLLIGTLVQNYPAQSPSAIQPQPPSSSHPPQMATDRYGRAYTTFEHQEGPLNLATIQRGGMHVITLKISKVLIFTFPATVTQSWVVDGPQSARRMEEHEPHLC
jgi:hypothetical protein